MDPPPPPPPAQPPPPSAPPSASPLSAPIAAAPIPPTSTTPATMGPPATTAATAAAATAGVGYPDSIDSSPRSRTTDSYFDEQPPPPLPKLRLMCSYGGHIVPRPHDKSLCYVGGDTRIVVVDRHTTLSSLSVKLSNTLLNCRPFTLKYQLPSEDLDSLISVTTDEDLDNMIEEYDRTASNGGAGGGNKSRLRLFLFPIKPDSSQSIGPLLESSAKSEDWFLNALNGATAAAAGLLNRGFSDSASVNCLLGLDEDALIGGGNMGSGNSNRDVEVLNKNLKQSGGSGGGGGGGGQDVHSVPDSPMLETTSSFGSTSSSPSLANLPPIRVHVDEPPPPQQQQKVVVGIEEQFAQMNVGGGSGGVGKQADESMVVLSSPPPMPVSIMPVGVNTMVMSEYQTRVISDDERSDHGVPVGYRKPPPPGQSQPPQQQALVNQAQQQKSTGSGGGGSGNGGGIDLHSPDSVSSDSSLSNAINRQRPAIYQESVVQIHSGASSRVPGSPVDPKINVSDPNTRVQIQHQVQDSGYVLQSQFDQQQQQLQQQQQQQQLQQQQLQQQQLQQQQLQQQQLQQQTQQYVPAGAHFIQHHPTGVQIPAYYSVYPPQPQQQHHHQLGQQYPVYYLQGRQAQPYNLPVQQSSISDSSTTIPSSRPQTPPPSAVVSSSAGYNPMRTAPVAKPEMANAGMYGTTASGTPQLVQVPPGQHQQQYVGYSQVHHPSQSVAPASAGGANYAYEYVDPAHAHLYYTQPLAHTIPAQYQTMTAAAAVGLPEASAQLPTDNIKQQIRTSQPI